jgi:hypothetical protein
MIAGNCVETDSCQASEALILSRLEAGQALGLIKGSLKVALRLFAGFILSNLISLFKLCKLLVLLLLLELRRFHVQEIYQV